MSPTKSQITSVEKFGDSHWDELDTDIERDALKFPERYPLKFK